MDDLIFAINMKDDSPAEKIKAIEEMGVPVDDTYVDVEWKDKPDEDSMWWFYGIIPHVTKDCKLIRLAGLFGMDLVEIEGHHYSLSKLSGKWQKAIIPPLPEE